MSRDHKANRGAKDVGAKDVKYVGTAARSQSDAMCRHRLIMSIELGMAPAGAACRGVASLYMLPT